MQKEIGKRIKELRNQSKMNQEQFASFVGISRSNISKWESGQLIPSIEMLGTIAKKFNKDVKYFLTTSNTTNDGVKLDDGQIKINNTMASGVSLKTINKNKAPNVNSRKRDKVSKPQMTKARIVWLVIAISSAILAIIGLILCVTSFSSGTGMTIKHLIRMLVGMLLFFIASPVAVHATLRYKRW